MNIDKTQLLTVVKVIEKLQSKLKDNTANIDELNKDMSNLSMELKDIEQELSNNISDTNNKLKQELQTLLNDLQRQFKNDREAKDIKLINYNQDNKLGLQELKTTLQDLSDKLQDYASKDIVNELSDKTDENTKDIIKTNKELDKTNKKIDKVSDKVDKMPKVDLSDYAKKKDIPKEIVKTETIKEKVLPIEIGNVNTVDPGVEANAKLTPKKDKYILDLDIPRGVTGAGRKGQDGLTTSVNNIEQVNGNIPLDTDDIPETTTNMYVPTLPTDNPTSLYLNGSREWKPTSIGGGGYNANLYFTTLDSDIMGYKKIEYEVEATETELIIPTTTTEILARTYLFDYGLATTVIDAGLWVANYRAKVSNSKGATIRFEAFLRHTDNTETILFSSNSDLIINSAYATLRNESNQPAFACLATDRLGVRIYTSTTHPAGVTLNTIVGDGHGSYFYIPLKIRHNQLRNLNEDRDYQHITDADRTKLNNTSGVNTGDKPIIYGTVATASATVAKEVTIAGYTPTAGDILCITYTLGTSAASPKLAINGGSAIPIYLGSTAASAVTHTVGANGEVMYLYDGTNLQMFGSMRTSDADTTQYVYWSVASTAGTAFGDYKLLMQTTDGKWHPLTNEEGVGTTKTISTQDFLVNSPILFYATTTNVAQDASFSNAYTQITMINTLRYTDNQATRTSRQNIYLKGTITNGLFRLDNTSATSFITQTLPTTDDGFVYIRLGYMYTTANMLLTVDHPIYQYKDGAIRQYSPVNGGSSLSVVDRFSDLPTGADGDMAIVKMDTLAPRTWTTMAKNTLYSRLYVNPLPYVWSEDYEDYIGLSLDAGGTQIYAAVEPSETEGFILCTLQLKGILLSAATAMAVQQNYMNAPFEISFDGKIYIEVEGGWINTLAYVDNATNEVIDVTMTPTNVGNIKSFADTYLLTANDTADEWLRVKYLIQPTPFTINYSGVYEKIDSVWTLVMRNDKLVNGNTTAPE